MSKIIIVAGETDFLVWSNILGRQNKRKIPYSSMIESDEPVNTKENTLIKVFNFTLNRIIELITR